MLGRLPGAPAQAAQALATELDHQNDLTISYAQKNKLSARGPTTLGVRTGLLRRSIHRTDSAVTGLQVRGALGSNLDYAGVHEYGFDGDVQVRAFTRHNRGGDLLSAGKKKPKLVASGISYVKAFTRHMRMPPRSFIGSSLRERLPLIERGLSRAVVGALEGQQS